MWEMSDPTYGEGRVPQTKVNRTDSSPMAEFQLTPGEFVSDGDPLTDAFGVFCCAGITGERGCRRQELL